MSWQTEAQAVVDDVKTRRIRVTFTQFIPSGYGTHEKVIFDERTKFQSTWVPTRDDLISEAQSVLRQRLPIPEDVRGVVQDVARADFKKALIKSNVPDDVANQAVDDVFVG